MFRFLMAMMLAWGGTLFATEGYADLIEEIQGAVVNVQTTQTGEANPSRRFDPFDFFSNPRERMPQRESRGAGTGFFISADGYIVTNRHVVEGASEIIVQTTDDRRLIAELIGTDGDMDVALIKVDVEDATFLEMADSDKSRIGDVVLALGYPLQLGFSVTTGIVSGIGRNLVTGEVDLATYIQTDADITFGNSGGPLVNSDGQVVGLNTLIVSRGETYGFAIPSNLFARSIDELRTYGTVRRGALGVQVGNLSEEAREFYGVDAGALIISVTDGLPAKAAGLKRDDVILEINDQQVRGADDVVTIISNLPPAAEVEVKYLSRKEPKTTRLRLGNRKDLFSDAPSSRNRDPLSESFDSGLGFSAVPMTPRMKNELGLENDMSGMVIRSVEPDSLADRKGLALGTIVTHVNDVAVSDEADFRKAMQGVKEGELIPVRVVILNPGAMTMETSERTVFLRRR